MTKVEHLWEGWLPPIEEMKWFISCECERMYWTYHESDARRLTLQKVRMGDQNKTVRDVLNEVDREISSPALVRAREAKAFAFVQRRFTRR